MNTGPWTHHSNAVTSQFQASDRLRDILERARARSAEAAPAPAPEPAQAEATVEALLDRNQPLPDPRALSRLYKEQALAARLPENLEAEVEPPPAPGTAAPGWGDLPAPAPLPHPGATDDPPPPPVWAEPETHTTITSPPPLSAAELRTVMQKLQSDFGGSYALYELPKAPADDSVARSMQAEWDEELAELKRLAEESQQSNKVFIIGALVVVVVLGAFIYLAAFGPLKAPPTPTVSPTPTAAAGHR